MKIYLTTLMLFCAIFSNAQNVKKTCKAGNLKEGSQEWASVIMEVPKGSDVLIIYEVYKGCDYFKVKYNNIEGYLDRYSLGIPIAPENELYSNALSGSYFDCDIYLKNYPEGKFVTEIKKLRIDKYTKLENNLYTAAISGKTEDCDNYIKQFPNGKYIESVKKLRIDKYNKQKENELPSIIKGGISENGKVANIDHLIIKYLGLLDKDSVEILYALKVSNGYIKPNEDDTKYLIDKNDKIKITVSGEIKYIHKGNKIEFTDLILPLGNSNIINILDGWIVSDNSNLSRKKLSNCTFLPKNFRFGDASQKINYEKEFIFFKIQNNFKLEKKN